MRKHYLEVTFRKGKPLAAYLYLPRESGSKSVRTVKAGNGILVDYGDGGTVIGLESTAPTVVTVEQINAVLDKYGLARPTKHPA